MKNKVTKKIKFETLYNTKIGESESTDESVSNENNVGFSFHPKSKYIFIFEMILILANLYSFFIPLRIAKNQDIGGNNTFNELLFIFLLDLIYIVDIIINFFKGYYNHDMDIIRNNKQIIIHYIKQDFIMDILETIPLCFLIKKGVFEINMNFGESSAKLIFLKLIAFFKPF